ncbi:MAG: FAD binding domain-containing protein [Cyclobacteriaceae bacterium]
MVEFILNNETIRTEKPSGFLLLDLIRYDKALTGTKIGCREGDCGACTILIGEVVDGQMKYISATSCLTPIGNVHGKHVVTVEGLNMEKLSPVQHAMIEESGTQCGFCTVGFVVSLSGYCLENSSPTYDEAIAAIDGNICRCTGYKSIERAAKRVTDALAEKNTDQAINWLIEQEFIPTYFAQIPDQLKDVGSPSKKTQSRLVGGGTDLYVQRAEEMVDLEVGLVNQNAKLRFITEEDGTMTIGGGSTVSDLANATQVQQAFPRLHEHVKLVSSSPIRNISTIAGNFVNASPIGDFTAFFLALDTQITLSSDDNSRTIFLKDFYQGYKVLDKSEDEIISSISFKLPTADSHFNFEKISKREHLDIASVNTALQIEVVDGIVTRAHISAGGVAPIPTYLHKTVDFLEGKEIAPLTVKEANEIMQSEVSPISDARGSADYKRLALRQLFFAHFIKLFPNQITMSSLK